MPKETVHLVQRLQTVSLRAALYILALKSIFSSARKHVVRAPHLNLSYPLLVASFSCHPLELPYQRISGSKNLLNFPPSPPRTDPEARSPDGFYKDGGVKEENPSSKTRFIDTQIEKKM